MDVETAKRILGLGETLSHYKILDLDPRSQVLGHY